MPHDPRIDRKQFLTFSLAAAGGLMLGCATSETGTPDGGGGSGGAAGGTGGHGGATGGTGGTPTGGTGGTPTGGTGGTPTGGTGGTGGTPTGGTGGSGGAGGSTGAPTNCSTSLKITITNNHGHELKVTLAEITAHATKIYSTKGIADHDHYIQLTAADYQALASGLELRKPSCNDDHEHEFIVNCHGTEGDSMTAVAAYCGSGTDPNRKCGETMAHLCPDTPYPKL